MVEVGPLKLAGMTALVVMSLWSSHSRCHAAETEVAIERNLPMKTRDGVTLYADLYHPAGQGSFPVLLQRTPYNKSTVEDFAAIAAAHGFLVVVQDVRGRYTSEGEWYPFKHEKEDGYDAVEWAAALPGSNGKVGMYGNSYVGATQMLAAIGHPPHLAGVCPGVTASNYHENWTYAGGAFEQWFNQSWTSALAQDTFDRFKTNALTGSKALPLTRYPVFNIEPLENGAELTQELAPYYVDWLSHPTFDGYWKQWSIEDNYANIQVPALTIAAWYDIFLDGSLRNYAGLRDHAGNANARDLQRLVVAIGGHAGAGRRIGDVDFGDAAASYDENAIILDWYDFLFHGKQNEFSGTKPVRLFVMGVNGWRDEEAWPLKRAEQASYFLHSDGKANSSSGDGSLSREAPRDEQADHFVYDPKNPVPTVGGSLCCDRPHLPAGPRDQKDVETRSDVLVYSTPPLDLDTEVTGPVTLDLYASSSAVDTDFTAKLVDVWPNGFAQNLTDGILRARYRNSTSTGTPLSSGKVYELRINLGATSNVFLKGHRIRLEVSSSNFPRFDRNPNTGKSAADSAEMAAATNTIYHDNQRQSVLRLAIVPK